MVDDPMTLTPQWHALNREAELSAELIANGATALGNADHACRGLYTQAFFGLAIGMERLAKLIIVVDHATVNNGHFPDNQVLRKFGHGLRELLDACGQAIAKYPPDPAWGKRPNEPIHQEIVLTLDEFATISRYYNLDFLAAGSATRFPEPIGAWWRRVATPILERHYTQRMRERDKADAGMLETMFGDRAAVIHYNEAEEPIDSITALWQRAGATRVVQRYGRMYVLQIVRWLVEGLSAVTHRRTGDQGSDLFRGLDEPFVLFRNEDEYLRSRKTWSIYRP